MTTDLSDLDSLFKEVRTAWHAAEKAKPPISPKYAKTELRWKPVRVVLIYQHSILEPVGLFQEWAAGGGARKYTRLPDAAGQPEAEVIL